MRENVRSGNFIHYTLTHAAVILVAIAVLGVYMYSFFHKTMYQDFCLVNDQHLSMIESRHENDLRIMEDIVTQTSLADDITRFRLDKQPNKAMRLESFLNRYTLVSQSFTAVFYQFHGDDYLYSQYSSLDSDAFFDYECYLTETPQESFRKAFFSRETQMRLLPEQQMTGRIIRNYLDVGAAGSFYIFTVPGFWDETLMFLLPGSYYSNLLSMDGDARYDFLYHEGQLIAARSGNGLSREAVEQLLAEMEPTAGVQKEVTLQEQRQLLTIRRGASGVLYGTVQSMEVFHQKFRSEQWTVVLLIALCAIAATLAIGLFSGRMMRKVKNLSSLLAEEPSYDLGYIERGIQTLVVTKKASEEENQTFRKARFIRNFFRGFLESREDVIREARKIGLDVDKQYYLVVLLRSPELDNEDRIYSRMLELIRLEPAVEGYGIHLVNNNQNLFVLFSDSTALLEQTLQGLLDIERNYCQDYVFSVSDVHQDFGESSKAYLEADTAFDYRLLVSNRQVIRFRDVVQEDYRRLPLEESFRQLRRAVGTWEAPAVERALRELCSLLERQNVSLYAFRMVYNDILQIFLSESKVDKLLLDKFFNAFTISQCSSADEFYQLLSEACRIVMDSSPQNHAEKSNTVRDAIRYMQAHYGNPDLNMMALAEYLDISAVALSIAFKNEMEVKPSEYLANLRIEKAKELLRQTDMLVKDISVSCGYEDDGSFARRFKKHTGMSPGQYRDKHK